MRGKVTRGLLPRKEFKSLPQNPIIRTFSSRFSEETDGSGMASSSATPGFRMMRAFILSGEHYFFTHNSQALDLWISYDRGQGPGSAAVKPYCESGSR